MVAFGTDALEAGTVFAVVEGGVDKDFRLRTLPVSAGDDKVPLVEVPVTEETAWAFLRFAIQMRRNFNCAGVGKVGWWGDVFWEGRGWVKKSLESRSVCWKAGESGGASQVGG